jgi:hypothetical protein
MAKDSKKVVVEAEIKTTGVGALSKQIDGITKSTKGMSGAAKGATGSFQGTRGAVVGLNTALKAAGIGLVLAAIAISIDLTMKALRFFTKVISENEMVQKAWAQVLASVTAVWEEFRKVVIETIIDVYTQSEKFPKVGAYLEQYVKVIKANLNTVVNMVMLAKDAFDLWLATGKTLLGFFQGEFNLDKVANAAKDIGKQYLNTFKAVRNSGEQTVEVIQKWPGAMTELYTELGEQISEIDAIEIARNAKTKEQIEAEKKAREKLLEQLKKEAELRKKSEQDMFDLFSRLRHENTLADIEAADGKRKRMLSNLAFEKNQEKKRVQESLVSQRKKDQILKELEEKFQNDIAEINKTFKDAENKKAADEAQKLLDVQNETTLMLIQSLEQRALKELEIQRDKELKAAELMDNAEAMKAAIVEKYEAKKAKVIKKNLDKEFRWEEMNSKQKIGLAANTAGNLAKILGEETAAGKAMAVTQATIQTFLGAQQAFTSMSAIPVVGPALGVIAAGAAIASGIANVKSILSADDSGNVGASSAAGDAGSAASMSGPAPQMMSGAFELGAMEEPEPVKAFVVTDEMTNSQDQLANIRRKSTI